MRLKLKESPVFQAMKAAGETARNPLAESFATWANIKMVLVALFGLAAGTLTQTADRMQVHKYVVHQVAHAYGKTARSEEHTSELQSLMRISYAVFCLKQK